MRDDSDKWDAAASLSGPYAENGVVLTPVALTRQTLISGPQVLSRPEWPVVTWPAIAPSPPYALCLRRDRILLVDGPDMAEGWHETTACAVSQVSDAYAVFDISGDRALDVLRRGAEVHLAAESKSVARLLFGLWVLLYRIGSAEGFRMHVPSSQAGTLVAFLKLALAALHNPLHREKL